MIKKIFCYIMFTIPLALVLVTLLNASNIDSKGTTYKFKMVQYDPYDIFRGKFLNVALEEQTIYIDELIGLSLYYNEDNEENGDHKYHEQNPFNDLLIRLYKNNNVEEVENIFKKVEEITQIFLRYDEPYDILSNDYTESQLMKLFDEIGVVNSEIDSFDLVYQFYGPLTDIVNHNRTFEELFNIFKVNYPKFISYSEDDRRRIISDIENTKYYIQIENDSAGYAKLTNIVDTVDKIKTDSDYIAIGINYTHDSDLIRTFDIDTPEIKYYADERYSKQYENSINYAMRKDANVYVIVKVYNGNMIIKDIMIDDMTLDDYYNNVYKDHEDEDWY